MAIETISDDGLENEKERQGLAIVKFYADWCGACKLIAPKFKRISEDEQYKDIRFLEANAEKNPLVRRWAGVTNLPFFATIKDGRIVEAGMAGKEEKVIEMLNKLVQA